MGLTGFVLVVVAVSLALAATGTLNLNDKWWDVTVFVLVVATIASFTTGVLALRRERTVLVVASIVISSLLILFCLLHSLILHD